MRTVSTSKGERAYHHGDLRGALVAAALAQLEEGGAAGLSLRASAKACGVSAMAPYRHFPDKDALLAAVAERGFEDLADRLEAADAAAGTGPEALAAQGAAYVAFARARPALFRLMFMTAVPKPGGGRAYGTLGARVAALPGAALPAEDLTLAAWSLVHGLAALVLDGRAPLAPDAVEAAVRRVTLAFARRMAAG